MHSPPIRASGSFVPPTDGALYYPEPENVTLPLSPSDPRTSAVPHPTLRYGPIHPGFVLTESGFASDGSSSLPLSVHSSPLPANLSLWNGYLPHNIGPSVSSPFPGSLESVVFAAQNASRYNTVATTSQFTALPSHEQEHQGRVDFPSMTVSAPTSAANSYAEHVVLWYYVLQHAVVVSGPRLFVPQTLYQPSAQGDRDRYVSLATLCSPIVFIREGSPEWGVSVQNLLSNQPAQLVQGNEPAFTSCGPSIGIRLQWPGYYPFHKQVSTKDFTHRRNIINKAKLAKVIAKCIMQYMETMSTQAMQVGSDGRWRVDPSNIRVDDVILVSVHHVSQGSWQPHLRLRRAIGTIAAATSQSFFVPDSGA